MSGPRFPEAWSIEPLNKSHPRRKFKSGNYDFDEWLKKSALQSQKKHLTTTKVLLDADREIAGYYTLAFSQVDFLDLPADMVNKLPRRQLPVSVLAWLGVDQSYQSRGVGQRLLATSLEHFHFCHRMLPDSPRPGLPSTECTATVLCH